VSNCILEETGERCRLLNVAWCSSCKRAKC